MPDQDLIKLQRKWYAKLKKKGFRDIERFNRHGTFDDLFNRHTSTRKAAERCVQDMEYFRAARHFFWDHRWRNPRDKRVWQLHCEGVSYRDIMREFRRAPYQKLRPISFREVYNTVNKIKTVMRNELLYGQQQSG